MEGKKYSFEGIVSFKGVANEGSVTLIKWARM